MNTALEPFRTVAVGDAAKALGVHEQTVRRWIRDKQFPAISLGERRVRILLSDLEAHLKERSTMGGDGR